MAANKTYPCLTADEAAALIPNGAMVVSGFTPAGAPKSVPRALAKRARELHQAGAALNFLEHGAMLPDLDLTIFEPHPVCRSSNGG